MKKVIVAYIPVLHEGYRRFIEKHKDAKVIYIFGKDIILEFDHLSKEIRALDPKLVLKSLESCGLISKAKILKHNDLQKLNNYKYNIVVPDEDVTKELSEKYLKKASVFYDPIFLRWDKHKSMEQKPIEADQKISSEEFDKNAIRETLKASERASDWWRRVGAAIVKNKKIIIIAHNRHLPSPHSPYANGDPRNNFHKGVNIELSTAIHAEADLISQAAKKGIPLKGSSMYVSVFPCPPCAKLVARSGISKLYYGGGYGVLDGEDVLKASGVEIIYVDLMAEK